MTLLDSLLILGRLDQLPRTGWLQHGISPAESIAGHTLGVAHLALATLPEVQPELDQSRVLGMILVHDAPEAESGDLPHGATRHLPRSSKQAMEDAIAHSLFGPLPHAWVELFEEYESGRTREARFARLCDKLQLGVRCLAYARAGWRGLREFREGLGKQDCSEFDVLARLQAELKLALTSVR